MSFETMQERRYRELVEGTGIFVIELDRGGIITSINRAAERFSGYSAGEIVGKHVEGVLVAPSSPDATRLISLVDDLAQGKETGSTIPLASVKKNGDAVWVLWTFHPVHDEQGAFEGIIGAGQDISGIKHSEQALRERNRELDIIAHTSRRLNTTLTVPAVFRTLVATAMELTGAAGGTAGIYAGGNMVFTEYNRQGTVFPIDYSFAPGIGVPGWVSVNKRSYFTNDAAHDQYLLPPVREEFGISTLANIPIVDRRGELLGCFEIHNKAGGRVFDAHEITLLESLAASASVAMENARVLEAQEKAEQQYRTIFETTGTAMAVFERSGEIVLVNSEFERLTGYRRREIEGKMNWRSFVAREDLPLAETYSARLRSDEDIHTERPEIGVVARSGEIRCCIVLGSLLPGLDSRSMVSIIDITDRKQAEESLRLSEERLHLIVANSPDLIIQQDRQLRYVWVPRPQLPDFPAGILGRTDFEIFPPDDAQQLAAFKHKVMDSGQGMRAEVSLPLRGQVRYFDFVLEPWRNSEGQVVGVLGFGRDITDVKMDQERLRESVAKERKTSHAIIDTMLKVVQIRDPYTAGHEEHTAELAAAIGREMGLSENTISGIRMGAVVHDIGKIFVPAEILSKPGMLSAVEFDVVKVHPSAGYDILRLIDFPWPVAEIVRQHHERYNGSGYPRGLKNGQILLEARVLMVADVIDSITLHRPYRPSIGIEKALKEIESQRGILYDPEVVDAALNVFREGKFKY